MSSRQHPVPAGPSHHDRDPRRTTSLPAAHHGEAVRTAAVAITGAASETLAFPVPSWHGGAPDPPDGSATTSGGTTMPRMISPRATWKLLRAGNLRSRLQVTRDGQAAIRLP